MDAVEPKRRVNRKKLSNITYPEEIVCQYSRLSHLLLHEASRKWLLYEWQYNEIDDAFFHKCRTFEMFVAAKFPQLKTRNLTQAEWRVIRKMILQRKCRRFSSKFIHEQRIELAKYRRSYRILQENDRHDELVKLNGYHDEVNAFISTLDSPQSQNMQLFRLFVDVKKLFALKSGLIMKLREINNMRTEIQRQQQQHQYQQQQHALVNGNSNNEPVPPTMTSATANKVMRKLRDCNKEIMGKLNQMMCFRIVKDATLINAVKRKNIPMLFSSNFFQRISSVQVYESQQLYRSQIFITTMDVQELLDILLAQSLFAVYIELMLRCNESVKKFTDEVIEDQMMAMTKVLSDNCIRYFEDFCLTRYFEILDNLSELLN